MGNAPFVLVRPVLTGIFFDNPPVVAVQGIDTARVDMKSPAQFVVDSWADERDGRQRLPAPAMTLAPFVKVQLSPSPATGWSEVVSANPPGVTARCTPATQPSPLGARTKPSATEAARSSRAGQRDQVIRRTPEV